MTVNDALRVAGAAMLGIGAVLAAGSARAELDADAGTGSVTYAKEALTTTVSAGDPNDTGTYYVVTNDVPPGNTTVANAALDVDMTVPVQVSAALGVYLRYDLQNMVFGAALGPDSFVERWTDDTRTGSVGAVASGGDAGDPFVVYAVNPPVDSLQPPDLALNDTAVLAPGSLGIMPDAPGSITVSVYTSAEEAFAGAGTPLKRKKLENVVKTTSGVMTRITHTTATADVDTGFTSLLGTGNGTARPLGSLQVSVANGALDASSGTVTLDELFDVDLTDQTAFQGGTVKLTGDFSIGIFHTDSSPGCASTPGIGTDDYFRFDTSGFASGPVLDSSKSQATLPVVFFTGNNADFLCVTIPFGNADAIPAGRYDAEVEFNVAAATGDNPTPPGSVFAPATVTGVIGEIDRGATTAHIPYLTTYAGYNNRIVITNRGNRDIDYTITYTPEAGTTATPGTDSKGMVAKSSTRVLSLSGGDVVTLSGSTMRTAATVELAGTAREVQVSTVIVNLEDGSTDTVVYMVEE